MTASLFEPTIGGVGRLLAWGERGTRQAWVSWVQKAGRRRVHKVVQVRAASLRPLERPEACQQVVRRLRGLNGKSRDAG